MTRYLLIILLLAGSVQAGQVVLEGGTTRAVLSDYDTVTISGTSISYTGRVLTGGGCDGVFIDGQGDTILFNTEDSVGTSEDARFEALYFNGTTNLVCSGLVVIDAGGGNFNTIMDVFSSKHNHFKDCKFLIKGQNSNIIAWPSGGNGNHHWWFESCEFESQVDSFTSRMANDAGISEIGCQGECIDSQNTDGYYTMWYDRCTVVRCPHTGFGMTGRTWVDSCNLYGQAHNDEYDYPTSESYQSADNAYLLGGASLFGGTRIVGCTLKVYAADPQEGAQGIILEAPTGTASNRVVVKGNYIDVSQGQSDYEGGAAGWGLRIRPHSDYGYPPTYTDVCSNFVKITIDTSSSTTHVGEMGAALYFTDGSGEFKVTGDSCRFYNNTFVGLADSTGSNSGGEMDGNAMRLEMIDSGQGHRWYDNHYISNGCNVQLGGGNGRAAAWHSERDTFELLTHKYVVAGNPDTAASIYAGVGEVGGAANWYDHIIIDPYWIGGDEDIAAAAWENDNTPAELFCDVHAVLTVEDSNGTVVPNAAVWMIDAYSDTTSGTSNDSGLCSLLVSYDYKDWSSGGADSTYNNYTIGAALSGDTTTTVQTVDWSAKAWTVTLADTDIGAGEPDPVTRTRLQGLRAKVRIR